MHGHAELWVNLLAIDPVSDTLVQRHVTGEAAIRVKAHLPQSLHEGKLFRVGQERAPVTTAMACGRHRDVDNQKVISLGPHLNQTCQFSVKKQQVHPMIANGRVVVGGHRLRLPSDDRHPLGVSRPSKVSDRNSVRRDRAAQPRSDGVRQRGCDIRLRRKLVLHDRFPRKEQRKTPEAKAAGAGSVWTDA